MDYWSLYTTATVKCRLKKKLINKYLIEIINSYFEYRLFVSNENNKKPFTSIYYIAGNTDYKLKSSLIYLYCAQR